MAQLSMSCNLRKSASQTWKLHAKGQTLSASAGLQHFCEEEEDFILLLWTPRSIWCFPRTIMNEAIRNVLFLACFVLVSKSNVGRKRLHAWAFTSTTRLDSCSGLRPWNFGSHQHTVTTSHDSLPSERHGCETYLFSKFWNLLRINKCSIEVQTELHTNPGCGLATFHPQSERRRASEILDERLGDQDINKSTTGIFHAPNRWRGETRRQGVHVEEAEKLIHL